MKKQYQNLIATLLLFCVFLQSCVESTDLKIKSGPEENVPGAHKQATESCPIAKPETKEAATNTTSVKSDELEALNSTAQVLNKPETKEAATNTIVSFKNPFRIKKSFIPVKSLGNGQWCELPENSIELRNIDSTSEIICDANLLKSGLWREVPREGLIDILLPCLKKKKEFTKAGEVGFIIYTNARTADFPLGFGPSLFESDYYIVRGKKR